MKRQLMLTTLGLFFLHTAYAAVPPQPQRCPNVGAIKAIGVSRNVIQDDDGLWFTGRRNQAYGTADHWTFLIGKIPATSAGQAYTRAAAAMNTLTFQLGPILGPFSKWICYYNTAEGYTAVTVNPPLTDNYEAVFLKK